ncbi:MAG: hypothetical protein ACE5J2_03620 [Nitrososphaerales archaeon]
MTCNTNYIHKFKKYLLNDIYELALGIVQNMRNRSTGIRWQRTHSLLKKEKWTEMLSQEMGLKDEEVIHLNEFLGNFGLVKEFGNDYLQTCFKFSISRQDEYVYVIIPYENGHKKKFVQYAIKILGGDPNAW